MRPATTPDKHGVLITDHLGRFEPRRQTMRDADYLKNLDAIISMSVGRRETKLQAFGDSFTVTTDMGADGQRRLEPILEVRPQHIGNTSAVLHMFEAALGLAIHPEANCKIKPSRSPPGIHIELAEGDIAEAALALATLEGIVQGTIGLYYNWSANAISAQIRERLRSFSFVSGGVLITPREAIRILFGGYAITHKGVAMNETRQLVPIVQLKIQVPKEARTRTAMEHLFEAMFESSSVRKESFKIQMEYSGNGLKLSIGLHQGTPLEAVRALQVLEACV
jgi:hypothetical protein